LINLEPTISQIEKLLEENTEASVTYAALECRLAIERICYERLRLVHEYISHDDLKKWQPKDIVKTLIQEVDKHAATTLNISVAPDVPSEYTAEGYEALDWKPLGTQIGFNPNKFGKLWNGLAKLALHIEVPTSKDTTVKPYGDMQAIASKVKQALAEIKQISKGTLMSPGIGQEVSYKCVCGSKNKRRLALRLSVALVRHPATFLSGWLKDLGPINTFTSTVKGAARPFLCRGVPCNFSERDRPRRIEVAFQLGRPVQTSPFVGLIKAAIGKPAAKWCFVREAPPSPPHHCSLATKPFPR